LSVRMLRLWSTYRKLAGPRLLQRPAPVILESAGGTSRYTRDMGASAVI
jgi:hypothetical protein